MKIKFILPALEEAVSPFWRPLGGALPPPRSTSPYPGTALYERYRPRMRVHDWRRYDTRHIVFEHPTMTAEQVESGYWEAYQRFYKLRSICEGARHHASAALRRKHLLYSTAWKKLDPLWNAVIRSALLGQARKVLERTLC